MRETKFTRTDIGVFPEDWKIRTIGETACVTTGAQNTQDKEDDGLYPFYVRSQKVERINKFLYDTEGVVTAGDGVGTGKVFHYVNGKFGLHQRCYLIYNFKEELNCKYFFWVFSQRFFERVQSMTAKSSVDSVRRDMITEMQIPIPPTITEQERIAEALSDVDGLLRELDGVIAKKRAIKQGAMQELLTGKRRLEGFGGEWEEKKLCYLFDFYKGYGLSKDAIKANGKNKCILYGEIFTTYDTEVKNCVSKTNHQEGLPSKIGDVLMPGSTTTSGIDLVKAICVNEDNILLGGDTIVLRPKVDYINSYFMASLISNIQRNKIAEMTQGITIIHLHSKDIVDISYTIPVDKEEQTDIAKILSDMDADIEALEAKRAKYEQLKQGMMQELLTGRIRLV